MVVDMSTDLRDFLMINVSQFGLGHNEYLSALQGNARKRQKNFPGCDRKSHLVWVFLIVRLRLIKLQKRS